MPASTLDPVNAALRSALKDENSPLDERLAGASKKALLADIDFESAGSYQSTVLDKLKNKYIVLKSAESPQPSKPDGDGSSDECLKTPARELYPLDAVQLGWGKGEWSVGAGMINMGNTCYLNSTLQALFHVPALVNWLIADKEHGLECQDSGAFCIICAMRKTLQDSQRTAGATPIRPILIYNKLRIVCRNLLPGRQEDAHEFLRYLVEAMEKSYLGRFKNHQQFDSRVKETTPLNQILGGYLRSAVRCLKCGHVSTTFQHFQDLLLDIRKAQTLDEALEGYFMREKLDDEAYQCTACQKKVPATKQFFLERAPMVLCVQLKRFSVSNNKITKHVNFRQRLDLTRYARHRPSVPLIYRLVALVTHMGPSVNCGHYTAVAQAPSGNFYQFDDSMVRMISHQAVFNTNAYIMLYELESSPCTPKTIQPTNSQATSVKPSPPLETAAPSTNGIGYTSDKVYGPELPPPTKKRSIQSENSTSSSDSDSETAPPQAPPPPTIETAQTSTPTKLVPYETDDSSGSDGVLSPPPAPPPPPPPPPECRVSTKATADFKMTSIVADGGGKVLGELHKMGHSGYSAPVASWNGNRAQLDKEVASERREERKRQHDGGGPQQGRTKHVKIGGYNNCKSNPGYNPVQEYHNNKNWSHGNGYKQSYYGGNRHRRNFHHKNFHKNYRYRQ